MKMVSVTHCMGTCEKEAVDLALAFFEKSRRSVTTS
jgi:hypothetical protein